MLNKIIHILAKGLTMAGSINYTEYKNTLIEMVKSQRYRKWYLYRCCQNMKKRGFLLSENLIELKTIISKGKYKRA